MAVPVGCRVRAAGLASRSPKHRLMAKTAALEGTPSAVPVGRRARLVRDRYRVCVLCSLTKSLVYYHAIQLRAAAHAEK